MTEFELLADHMPRWRRKRNTEISVIDIAQLGYSIERLIRRWRNNYWPIKKGDPGCPIIPIIIGPHKLKAICDMGAGMNVIPLGIYDDILQLGALEDPDERVVLPDQTTQRIEGYLDDICLTVGGSYVTADFVILHTGYDPKDPIILDQPFLHTVKASIYVAIANMCFDINGKKRRFTFNPPYSQRQLSQGRQAGLNYISSLKIFKTSFYRELVIKGWQDDS
jgi:hypothetical protein